MMTATMVVMGQGIYTNTTQTPKPIHTLTQLGQFDSDINATLSS